MIASSFVIEYLKDQIAQICSSHPGESLLFVFAGYDARVIDSSGLYPALSIPSRPSLDGKKMPKEAFREVFGQLMEKAKSGIPCYLDFLQVCDLDRNTLENLFLVKYLKCPLYRTSFPYQKVTLPPCDDSDDALQDLGSESLEAVYSSEQFHTDYDQAIGQFYRSSMANYLTPAEPLPWQEFDSEIGLDKKQHPEQLAYHTLTEDEGSWLALVEKLSTLPASFGIRVTVSNTDYQDSLVHDLERLDLFCDNHIAIDNREHLSERNNFPQIKAILQRHWQQSKFRSFKVYRNVRSDSPVSVEEETQENVIEDILSQAQFAQAGLPFRDIFVTAPTGTGKSVMFQIPAIHLHTQGLITLIISPLIALMNDQIDSLERKDLAMAATINSSISIVQKNEIIENVKSGNISILYLSPESLLSRSDISALIGERKIGLLVVDEAHIVTTWGKAFRPDYWYLGTYIQRLRRSQSFPIATFTATAIYRGPEDMFTETRDSLAMRDPITYFGYVPRNDIDIHFEYEPRSQELKAVDYNTIKFGIMTERLEVLMANNKKVLVYFPFVGHISDYVTELSTKETTIKPDQYSVYFGSLANSEKDLSLRNFRDGTTKIMLATKAFGMGVDIPDIDVVYHFAPTGNVCDYIQEVGRAARLPSMTGLAMFDYLSRDFSHVNRLHGISTIRLTQLLKVMRKIYSIGEQHGFRRNLLVTSESFQLIFDQNKSKEEKDFSDLDAKVKTALLIIEKDFKDKFGYSPIVARPRALFTHGWFKVPAEEDREVLLNRYSKYVTEEEDRVRINLKGIWQEGYPNLSFAKFKYQWYATSTNYGFKNDDSLVPLVLVSYRTNSNVRYFQSCSHFIDSIVSLCNELLQSGKFFSQEQLCDFLIQRHQIDNKPFVIMLAESVFDFLSAWSRANSTSNFGRFFIGQENRSFRIANSGYSDIRSFFNVLAPTENKIMRYESMTGDNKQRLALLYAMLGLLDAAQLLEYEVTGGESPEIFIRINSYFRLRQICYGGREYNNRILQNVWDRHKLSVRFLDYLFKTMNTNSAAFWSAIEEYFLGKLPDQLLVSDDESVFMTK